MVEDREFDDGMMKEEGRGREDEKLMRGCRRKKKGKFSHLKSDRQAISNDCPGTCSWALQNEFVEASNLNLKLITSRL
jgi:hypothetical protein